MPENSGHTTTPLFDVEKAKAALPTAKFTQTGETECIIAFGHSRYSEGTNLRTVIGVNWRDDILHLSLEILFEGVKSILEIRYVQIREVEYEDYSADSVCSGKIVFHPMSETPNTYTVYEDGTISVG